LERAEEEEKTRDVMKVNSDELTETEKDLIDIYGESRILKVIWCYENDASIRQSK